MKNNSLNLNQVSIRVTEVLKLRESCKGWMQLSRKRGPFI